MKYVIDIDGTICSEKEPVEDRIPIIERINYFNSLYDTGNTVVYHTARGLKSGRGESYYRPITEKQLKEWGVKYHELSFKKHDADFFIDDKCINVDDMFLNRNKKSYVTLLSDSSYLPGLYALNNSLKMVNSMYDLHVLVTENISESTIFLLKKMNFKFTVIPDYSHIKTDREKWSKSLSKIHVFDLNYLKVVFLDLDTIVLHNIDFLFELECKFAAVKWGAEFNTGVMVIEPDLFFTSKLKKNLYKAHYKMGDQTLINRYLDYFSDDSIVTLDKNFNVVFSKFAEEKNPYVIHFTNIKPWFDINLIKKDKNIKDYQINYLEKWKEIYENSNVSYLKSTSPKEIQNPTNTNNKHLFHLYPYILCSRENSPPEYETKGIMYSFVMNETEWKFFKSNYSFFELKSYVEENIDEIVKELNSRWLLSLLECYIDESDDEIESLMALCLSSIFRITQSNLSVLINNSDIEYDFESQSIDSIKFKTVLTEGWNVLYDGIPLRYGNRDNVYASLYSRLKLKIGKHNVFGKIQEELFKRTLKISNHPLHLSEGSTKNDIVEHILNDSPNSKKSKKISKKIKKTII